MNRASSVARAVVLSLLAPLALVLATSCKPKENDKCTAGQATCLDGQNALVCAGGTYAKATCGGPQGCVAQSQSNSINCDNTLAQANDGCQDLGDIACQVDKKAELTCDKNHFAVKASCKGPHGCAIKGEKLFCDNDYSDVGDICDDNGDYACSTDHKTALRCIENKFVVESTCAGPKQCRVESNGDTSSIHCDDDLALLNDPCHTDGDYACSVDKGMLLRCNAQKFTAYNACRGPRACTLKEHPVKKIMEFDCDDDIARVGDPCDTPSEVACTADSAQSLVCRGGFFAANRPCPKHTCKVVSELNVACK